MEDYEYKVIKLHATLFQNSSVGRRQWREDTRESGRRRFHLGNSSSSGGCFEIFSRSVFGDQSCCCRCFGDYLLSQVYYRAATPLPAAIADFYRILPTFYRSFGLSWETSAIKNDHSQDSLYYFFSTTPLSYSYFTDLSDFLARIESCQLISVVGTVDS